MRTFRLCFGLSSLLAACTGASPGQPQVSAASTVRAEALPAKDVHEIVGRLTSRTGTPTVTEGPGGIRIYQVPEGLGQVMVARTNSDGTVSTKCVGSEADSRSFLEGGSQK